MRARAKTICQDRVLVVAVFLLTLWLCSVGLRASEEATPSAERAFSYLLHLSGEIGERSAGSPGEERAAEYIHRSFTEWGLDSRIESFPLPKWEPKSSRVWSEGEDPLYLASMTIGFSGTTAAEGVSGEFVDVGDASPRHLAGKNLAGKIVLVKRDVYIDYPDYWLTERLIPRGVAGMIFSSRSGRHGGPPMTYFNYKRSLKEDTPPAAVITYEDAVRLVKSRPKRVTIVAEAEVAEGTSRNVIGDIRGASHPDELIVITAHNDTSINSPGAADDGGGTALIMELARAFSRSPRPARTLRFIGWGGHELGLMGSEAYLRAHADENVVAMINFDGVGSTLGTLTWFGAGPDEWIEFLRRVGDESGLEPDGGLAALGFDSVNFAALKVPAVSVGLSHGAGASHTPEDNLKWSAPVGFEDPLHFATLLIGGLAKDPTVAFKQEFPPDLLQDIRDYAARWGWGVRPEANAPPPADLKDEPLAPLTGLPPASPERAFDYLVHLVGAIGERPVGSEGEKRAADYIHAQFSAWGLDSKIETFPLPIWKPRSSHVWTKGAEPLYFPSMAAGYGGTTPPEGITGELVDIGTASPRHLEGKDLDGKIVLVKRDVYIDYPDYWLTERLIPRGVAGMIFFSRSGRHGGPPMVYYNFKRSLKEDTPPAVVVTYEDAVHLLKSGVAEVGMVVEADVAEGESRNIIGEIHGSSHPDEVILVGAHNDTSINTPGANDDGGGVAIVMELARAFSRLPQPARTLRFIGWGGHEPGLMGSEAYLRAHPEEIDKVVAVVNFDGGLGATLSTPAWSAAGPEEWIQFIRKLGDDVGLEPEWRRGGGGNDATNFSALEIPGVSFGNRHSVGANHSPEDNLKWCSPVGLEDPLLLGGLLVSRLANDPSLSFSQPFPADLLQSVRDIAARWGWGIRPEANEPPPGTDR